MIHELLISISLVKPKLLNWFEHVKFTQNLDLFSSKDILTNVQNSSSDLL